MGLRTVLRCNPGITVVAASSTEASHVLRDRCRGFQLTCESSEDIRISFEEDGTDNGGNYFTLRAGSYWWEEDIFTGDSEVTLYIRAPAATGSVDVSVMEWS